MRLVQKYNVLLIIMLTTFEYIIYMTADNVERNDPEVKETMTKEPQVLSNHKTSFDF
jgi:hypothetical protein